MPVRLGSLCLSVLLAVLAATPAVARAGRGAGEDRVAEAIVAGINAERRARGLAPLQWSSDGYAQQRATEQPAQGTDNHAGFSSRTAATAFEIDGSWMTGETLYWGPSQGSGDAVRGWMQSSTHRNLLMHAEMTLLAVGVDCRDGALHAVAHVGSTTARDVPATPASPVVTPAGGEHCPTAAATPTPKPNPKPNPAPQPQPEPEPAPDPSPPRPTSSDPAEEVIDTPAPDAPSPSETVRETKPPASAPSPSPTHDDLAMAVPADPAADEDGGAPAALLGVGGLLILALIAVAWRRAASG